MAEYTSSEGLAHRKGIAFWNQAPEPEDGLTSAPVTGMFFDLRPAWERPDELFRAGQLDTLIAPRVTAAQSWVKVFHRELRWRLTTARDALVHGT